MLVSHCFIIYIVNHCVVIFAVQGVTYKDASCYQSLRKRQDTNLSMEHVTSGHSHHQAGRSAQAHRSYNRALQVWPENPDALVCRGALYTKDGDFPRALSDLKAARKYGR